MGISWERHLAGYDGQSKTFCVNLAPRDLRWVELFIKSFPGSHAEVEQVIALSTPTSPNLLLDDKFLLCLPRRVWILSEYRVQVDGVKRRVDCRCKTSSASTAHFRARRAKPDLRSPTLSASPTYHFTHPHPDHRPNPHVRRSSFERGGAGPRGCDAAESR